MDSNGINKIIVCSVLGVLTCTAAILNFGKSPDENELSANAKVKSQLEWGISNGRYSNSSDKIESDMTTTSETASDAETELSETSFTSDETTSDSETLTETFSETSDVSDVSDVSDSDLTVSAETAAPESETAAETAAPPSSVSVSNPVPQSTPKDSSYFDSCVFVGDSIMEGLSAYKFFPESQVFASVGLNPYQLNTNAIDTYYGKVTPLSAVVSAKPSTIYIMMGMNGVAWNMNDQMIEQISIFIDNIKEKLPSSKIYIMSVTPVSAEREAKPSAADGQILNSQIDTFNSALLSLANDKSVYYLDVNSYLKGSNGCLPSDVTSDGIHIAKTVYSDILSYILSHTV